MVPRNHKEMLDKFYKEKPYVDVIVHGEGELTFKDILQPLDYHYSYLMKKPLNVDDEYKKILGYLGKVSGRDEDKITNSNLTISHSDNTPYFEEGKVPFCTKCPICHNQTKFNLITIWHSNGGYGATGK